MSDTVMGKLLLRGGGDQYEAQWDAEAKVTPMGSLVFFLGSLLSSECGG